MSKAQEALRLAQSVPETVDNWQVIRELVHLLADLVAIADRVQP